MSGNNQPHTWRDQLRVDQRLARNRAEDAADCILDPLDDQLADTTVRDYVCSNCWGHLLKYPRPGHTWLVKCHRCGNLTKGYVTKAYAGRRKSESVGDLMDVKINLESVLPGIKPRKSPDETMKDLGY